MVAIVVWAFLAYLELIVFFALACGCLCMGALCASRNAREFHWKLLATLVAFAVIFALGFDRMTLNLFNYTPQAFFANLAPQEMFEYYFRDATTVLIRHLQLGGRKVFAFYGLAIIGGFLFLRQYRNSYARKVVFAALSLEVGLILFSAMNWALRGIPINFFYAELMGIGVLAVLAATTIWTALRFVLDRVVGFYSPESRPPEDRVPPSSGRLIFSSGSSWLSGLALIGLAILVLYKSQAPTHFSTWPPRTDGTPARIQVQKLAIQPGDAFKGRGAVLVGMDHPDVLSWPVFVDVISTKYRQSLGYDMYMDAMAFGVPIVNEYGHWTSPAMLALLATAFYDPRDHIGRAAQSPRVYRANLARLLGVSLVVSDKALLGEKELYSGRAMDHPLYIHQVSNPNLGQYSPTRFIVANSASMILDALQEKSFDGRAIAIVEKHLTAILAEAETVSLRILKGPKIQVDAKSSGTSLLVLPFDFSHCLRVEGEGVEELIPVNLAQSGIVFSGNLSVAISYRYGLLHGTECRKQDLERIKRLGLETAAVGRLFGPKLPAPETRRQ
jgi:hypothetical protein